MHRASSALVKYLRYHPRLPLDRWHDPSWMFGLYIIVLMTVGVATLYLYIFFCKVVYHLQREF